MKRTGPGLMPPCGMPCLSLLRGEMQRILEGHPSATPEQCAWLRQQTIELCRAIDLLAEERDGAWEDEAWFELRAQHLASAPPGVRLLPWEAGTQIEWTSDSETWHPAEVVDRWYLQDLEQEAADGQPAAGKAAPLRVAAEGPPGTPRTTRASGSPVIQENTC